MANTRYNPKLKESMHLERYYTLGLSLLQLMLLVGSIGLAATAIYQWLH